MKFDYNLFIRFQTPPYAEDWYIAFDSDFLEAAVAEGMKVDAEDGTPEVWRRLSCFLLGS